MQIPALVRRVVVSTLFAAVVVAQQEEAAPGRTRVYDVRDIVRAERVQLPANVAEAAFETAMSEEAWPAIEIGDLSMLVRMATSQSYWEEEHVEFRPEDAGLLVVTCDEEMHAGVRDVLSKVRRMLFEPVVVEVHELPGEAIVGHAAVLSASEADAMLNKVGEHRVHVGRADPQQPLLLESKRIQNRIAGMNMKVAQEAAVPDLRIATDVYGASWQVRTQQTVGGDLLVTVSGSDRKQQKGPVCELPTGVGDAVASLELAATRIATCHASAYLGQGQAMLIGADAPGGVALCVRVHPGGAQKSYEIGEVTVYPVAALVGGPAVPGDVRVPYEEATLYPEADADPMPAVFDEGRLMEWIANQVASDSWDGSPNTMNYLPGKLIVTADEDTRKQVAARLEELQAIDRRQFSLEVAFGEIPAGTSIAAVMTPEGAATLAGVLPQRCVSVVSASRYARVSATTHVPYVKDYDAAIASGAAVTSPALGSYASGFVMQGAVVPMDQVKVRLDVRLAAMGHGAKREVFAMRDPRFAGVDRVDVRENEVSGGTVVGVGEWVVLRVGPMEGGGGSCAVVARVRVAR